MDGNMTKEKKALLYLKKIKDPKVKKIFDMLNANFNMMSEE